MIIDVIESMLNKFKDDVERLNKKSDKMGIEKIQYKIISTHFKQNDHNCCYKKYYQVEIFDYIEFGDYKVVAVIDTIKNGKNIIRAINHDLDLIPLKYRTIDMYLCECCFVRRFRTKLYILLKNNEYIQVGSSCVSDYTKFPDIENYLNLYTRIMNGYNDDINSNHSFNEYVSLETYLAYVIETVKENGFVSIKSSIENGKISTANMAYDNLLDEKKSYDMSETKLIVKKIIDFFKKASNKNSNYIFNIQSILEFDYVDEKYLGMIAYMPEYYNRMQDKVSNDINSDFVGSIKDKIEVGVELLMKRIFDGDYGATHFYKFKSGDNIFVWNSSNDMNINVGDTVTLKGTVKRHKVYNGVKQTVLTRCKIN